MPLVEAEARGPRWVPAPDGPPLPMADELFRSDLVRRLAARWTKPLTLLVAGPGFGKSTVLGQTVRDHALEPSGIEVWVSCHAGHEQAEHFASAILAALGAAPRHEDPVTDVLDALRRHSPLDVCVIIDDVHDITPGSSAARLLGDVVRSLPAHAHLVLAGRDVPALPLARLRAADGLLEFGEDDLVFTASERSRLAHRLGRDDARGDAVGGWPALVRLALAVDAATSMDYAREEVLDQLGPDDRRALFGLVSIGEGDDDVVSRITGSSVRLAALAEHVPLMARVDAARYRAHELWLEALLHVLDPDDVRTMQLRAVDVLAAQGELGRAGALAVSHCEWDALGRVAFDLVSTTISALPLDIAAHWLEAVPIDRLNTPGLLLLSAAVRLARDFADASVDGVLDEVADAYRAAGQGDAELVALAVGTVAAQSRCDVGRLLALATRATGVPGADRHPIVRLATHSIAGVVAEMRGDPEAALAEFDAARLDDVPAPLALAADRFRVHCLLLAGRADEAVAVSDRRLAATGNVHCRQMPMLARWLAGDPTGFLDGDRRHDDAGDTDGLNSRDAFVASAIRTVMLASIGQRAEGEVTGFLAGGAAVDNPRDAALITNAIAASAVLDHDETAAAAAFGDFVARHPLDHQLGERHLRRFLALGYVLHPEVRDAWDRAELGPAHQQARTAARALLAARRGRRRAADRPLPPPVICTALPLPWSMELACRRTGFGADDGPRLAAWLVDHLGQSARDELRRLAAGDDPRLAADANVLLGRLPIEPADHLEVAVVGPVEIRRDGQRDDATELRRARVRELLSILVVEPDLRRDRAMELLWPELDAEAGSRNLRVTLAHLRRLLEPSRPAGEAGFHLRTDGAMIRLFASPKLTVDLWELRRLAADGVRARNDGDIDTAVELLEAATSWWRGTPLTDLDRLPGFDAPIEEARFLHVSSLLALGELRLTQGRAGLALGAAERALAIDPYLEQAHRLAIAAHVQRHDPCGIAAAARRVVDTLADLGVDPEPATVMMLRHAAAQEERCSNERPLVAAR